MRRDEVHGLLLSLGCEIMRCVFPSSSKFCGMFEKINKEHFRSDDSSDSRFGYGRMSPFPMRTGTPGTLRTGTHCRLYMYLYYCIWYEYKRTGGSYAWMIFSDPLFLVPSMYCCHFSSFIPTTATGICIATGKSIFFERSSSSRHVGRC